MRNSPLNRSYPLRRIIQRHTEQWGAVEELECGHFNKLPHADYFWVNRNWRKGIPVRARRCELCVEYELDRFMATQGNDEARLAMGLEALRVALSEARERHLTGWAEEITEYVHALETGQGLNRPLTDVKGKKDA